MSALIEDCAELVYRVASKFDMRDKDDLISAGMEALWRAEETYNPDRGVRFKSYAGSCILNAMRDVYRRANFQRRYRVSMPSQVEDREVEPRWILQDFLRAAINDQETLDILHLRFCEGHKLREIAILTDTNIPWVNHRVQKGIRLLRLAAIEQGLT
jgi:RNA polymerase sigma factor (sigma-70 family)